MVFSNLTNVRCIQDKQELFWGGPLSFDMVHTHILNMKMRRSRLKEKLKEAALKRKDRELAKEHGFNSQVWNANFGEF